MNRYFQKVFMFIGKRLVWLHWDDHWMDTKLKATRKLSILPPRSDRFVVKFLELIITPAIELHTYFVSFPRAVLSFVDAAKGKRLVKENDEKYLNKIFANYANNTTLQFEKVSCIFPAVGVYIKWIFFFFYFNFNHPLLAAESRNFNMPQD